MKILSFLAGIVGFVAGQAGILSFLPHTAQVIVTVVSGAVAALGIRAAAPQDTLAQILDHLGQGWKTALGSLMAALGYVLDPSVLGTLPTTWAHVIQIVGVVLAALGLYHAQVKK